MPYISESKFKANLAKFRIFNINDKVCFEYADSTQSIGIVTGFKCNDSGDLCCKVHDIYRELEFVCVNPEMLTKVT